MSYHGGAPRVRRAQTGQEADTSNDASLQINTDKLLDVAVTAGVTAATTAIVNGYMNR